MNLLREVLLQEGGLPPIANPLKAKAFVNADNPSATEFWPTGRLDVSIVVDGLDVWAVRATADGTYQKSHLMRLTPATAIEFVSLSLGKLRISIQNSPRQQPEIIALDSLNFG